MEGLKDALFRSLAKRSPKSEERDASVRAGQLLKRMGGSLKDAAAKVGASPRTLKRWLSGESSPKAANNEALNRANRDVLVPQGRRDRLMKSADDRYLELGEDDSGAGTIRRPEGVGSPRGGFVVDATIRVSKDTRRRVVNLGEYMSKDQMADFMASYLSGNPSAAEVALTQGFEAYVPAAEVLVVHGVHFAPLDYGG